MANRRYRNIRVRVYRATRQEDEEGWGVDSVEYEFLRRQTLLNITTSALGGAAENLAHGRDEIWTGWDAVCYTLPEIKDGDLLATIASDGSNETIFKVRKSLPLDRNKRRLIVDERPAFQMDILPMEDDS